MKTEDGVPRMVFGAGVNHLSRKHTREKPSTSKLTDVKDGEGQLLLKTAQCHSFPMSKGSCAERLGAQLKIPWDHGRCWIYNRAMG